MTSPRQEPRDPSPARDLSPLTGRRIVLAVTGSIAAYKSVPLLRLLKKAGAHVEVILTEAATQFVGAATFRGLGVDVHDNMFSETPGELHVTLAREADLLLVAPATADTLARLRQGRGDDLLTATHLCFSGELVLAPAMHPEMWASPAVQENVAVLAGRGARFIGPVAGEVASGDVGVGRLAEPEVIVASLSELFAKRESLRGRHVVVTAGPTSEAIDPVRALTNVSSGKMGFAIAAEAALRGARVSLIAGPVHLPTPPGVSRTDVRSALEMREALWKCLGDDLQGADALVMSAAVADYRPKEVATEKLKRDGQPRTLELVPNPDLLAEIGAHRRSVQGDSAPGHGTQGPGARPLLVGFALETTDDAGLEAKARDKLARKGVDLVVANAAAESLGRDDNRVLFVAPDGTKALPRLAKTEIASHLLDWLTEHLSPSPTGTANAPSSAPASAPENDEVRK